MRTRASFNPVRAVHAFVRGDYVDREPCDRAFESMHQRDRIGDRVHLALGCLAMIGIGAPVTVTELALLPLVVFFLVRVKNTFKVWIHGFGQPAVLAALMLAAWTAITLLWSEDRLQGAELLAQLRWFVLGGFLFPVIERRGVLIGALCLGYLLGHLAQIADAFNGFGNEWLADALWHEPRRVSGWWDPAVGGSVLVGALGLHLAVALFGRGRWRVVGVLCASASLVALFATGTRGAWIGGAGLIVLCVLSAWWRGSRARRGAVVSSVCLIAALGAGALVFGPKAADRFHEARDEIARSMEGDTGTFTGARIDMARTALGGWAERPLVGIGSGSLSVRLDETESSIDDAAHAHNQALQWLSETGLVGLGLGVLLVGTIVSGAVRQARGRWGTYHESALWALIGLVLVSMFDTLTANTHTVALLGAIAALCPAYAPGMAHKNNAGAPESARAV